MRGAAQRGLPARRSSVFDLFPRPPEFLGEPVRWTPEHFVVAAVASCFVSTFSGMAEKSRLDFASFSMDAKGVLGNEDGIWRFAEIKLRPVVAILNEWIVTESSAF